MQGIDANLDSKKSSRAYCHTNATPQLLYTRLSIAIRVLSDSGAMSLWGSLRLEIDQKPRSRRQSVPASKAPFLQDFNHSSSPKPL